jgi:glycosyltransferase involved in cell wall biosynthesis
MRRVASLLRLVRNLPRLAAAATAGLAIRRVRRWRKRPPRIWRGMFASHLIPPQSKADRAAGFPSRSVVKSIDGMYELTRNEDFTVVLAARGVKNHDLLWTGLCDLLLHGDIWVAFFDGLFYPVERQWENRAILRLLRLVGIRLVMVNYGGDIITWYRNRGRYDWVSRLRQDYPHWDIEAESPLTARRIRMFSEFADFICNGDSSIDRMMPRRDLLFKYFPVDCRELAPRYTTTNPVPVVLHAPQHRYVKGTDHLLAAVDRLRGRGVQFELTLVERVPHREALALYADADILADQFCIGAWGAFAQEGLAVGKPVLTYLDQEHLGDPAFNLPLVNTNPENLERVLAALILVPELRERLGRAGRASVERYHSFDAIGEVWGHIYRHVWWGTPLELEETVHFGPSRVGRPFTEDPADPAFWPVPVDDLLPAIREALKLVAADAPQLDQPMGRTSSRRV